LVRWIDGARTSVRVSLLTYRTVGRDREYWDELESALRRAAARGVSVRLLAADWSKRAGTIEGLQSLEPLPDLEVKLVTIPAHSSGHIPYARVLHAKCMAVDGERVWIGTSNWERDYFEHSRNASVFGEGAALAVRVERFFDELWGSPYACAVDPGAKYEPPRVGD
jgi:phosphatidylserine/phosphatidylglycerophosphate/cardiolipin synthase-like enzyme